MLLPAISRGRHAVFGLSVCPSVRDHIVCEHGILQTARDNFTNLSCNILGICLLLSSDRDVGIILKDSSTLQESMLP